MERRTALKRTALKRGTSQLKRTAMKRSTSSKRARSDVPLAVWCEAKTSACTGRAVHRHHVRGRVGADADERTLDVCDACHRYVHAHPSESYEAGWMERRVT